MLKRNHRQGQTEYWYTLYSKRSLRRAEKGTWMRMFQRKSVLSDLMLHLLFGWHEEMAVNGVSSKEAHVKCAFANWVSDLWQVLTSGGCSNFLTSGWCAQIPNGMWYRLWWPQECKFPACGALWLSRMAQRLPAAARGSGDSAHYLGQIPSAKENQKSRRHISHFLYTLVPCHLTQRIKA